jgi:hypothetical protein
VGLKDHAFFVLEGFCEAQRLGISTAELKYKLFHGIMELWNDGIVGFQRKLSIFNYIIRMNFTIFPTFHYSTIPVRAKPLTFDKGIQWLQL